MTLQLKDWQEEEVGPLLQRKFGGISWDQGLGKTAGVSTIGARARLKKWLILRPDNATTVWHTDAIRWIRASWPEVVIHENILEENQLQRDVEWETQYSLGPNEIMMYVCTLDVFMKDWGETIRLVATGKKKKQFRPHKNYLIPDILIFDQCRRIRNRQTLGFQILQKFISKYPIPYRYFLNGSPGHEPKDFWTVLHLCNPRRFSSYWQFVDTFHEVIDGFYGKEILGPRNLENWYKVLGQNFSIIKETDPRVVATRPPMTRQLLDYKMDKGQANLYRDLHRDMLAALDSGDLIIAQNEFVLMTRLRQVLVCPKMLHESLEVGGAIKDFAEEVEPGEHSVIFCPFKKAFTHFDQYLRSKGFNVYQIYGGMGTAERDAQISAWRQYHGTIICSTLYAQAFSLEPATRSYAIGYDWDPDNNREAEKRLHRLTQQNPVTAYYYTARSTFDQGLCNILNIKQEKINLTTPSNLKQLLLNQGIFANEL